MGAQAHVRTFKDVADLAATNVERAAYERARCAAVRWCLHATARGVRAIRRRPLFARAVVLGLTGSVSPYGSEQAGGPENSEFPTPPAALLSRRRDAIQVAAGRVITLATGGIQNAVISLQWIKLVSGSNTPPVTHAVARQSYLLAKSFTFI
jgi:hypothetical protein